MVRKVSASTGPEIGALFADGTAIVCADDSGDRSSREAITTLAELGYIVETGERADGYAVHLGSVDTHDYGAIDACRRVIDESRRPLVRFATWPERAQSALSVTGDIDALTIWDFVQRFRGF